MLSVKLKKKRDKPNYRNWCEDAMSAAVADVRQNGMSTRKAAEKYSVPPPTLNNRTTGKIQKGARWGGGVLFFHKKRRRTGKKIG